MLQFYLYTSAFSAFYALSGIFVLVCELFPPILNAEDASGNPVGRWHQNGEERILACPIETMKSG